ncbi:AAA family ATPase [Nocardia sp. NPDC050175]|uniref:nSTAND1 domain-containing NTPase n=1 Tax=Nocardia sp. NPDC050175 TaxID=3364317 RepID=UPI0037B75E52
MNRNKGLFGERLTLLFQAAGTPPTKSVVRAVNTRTNGAMTVTEQRISNWRRAHRVPATFDAVRPVLEVLIGEATKRCGAIPGFDRSLLDLKNWRADWQASRSDAHVVAYDPDREPYRGLAPFRAEDADIFFGRESALRRLTDLVESCAAGDKSLVLLLGRSGTGKSSLLTAGLQAHPGARTPILLTPGADPLAALRTIPDSSNGDRLILVDQGEELFTLCPDEAARNAFLDVVHKLAATDVVVLALDITYVPDIMSCDRLATALRERSMLLSAMTDDELREAITAPAAAIGARVDQHLVDALLADVHTATSPDRRAALLPLLSHVLREIWSKRKSKTLTLDLYQVAGGISGAIAATAERVWSELGDNERETARRVLVALTLVGPHMITRNRIRIDILVGESTDPQCASTIIGKFVAARLLVQHDGEVELLHDALLTAWPRMTAWLTQEGELAPARQRIEDDARAWSAGCRPATLLYGKGRLDNAIELDARTNSLNRLAREFIAESARAEARRTRTRLLVLGAIGLLTVAVVALVCAIIVQRATSHDQCGDDAFRLWRSTDRLAVESTAALSNTHSGAVTTIVLSVGSSWITPTAR